ncbi:MAG: sulfotransferase family protein [Oceanospirillaceae bacterium]|nr:sulfotransferase family protein [Oceanospirillaceae bacterium]
MKKLHFISGLPRSGSTLLSAILRQNPSFYAGISSPVSGLFDSIISQLSAGSEFASMVNDQQKQALLLGLFTAYYQEQADKRVVLDTNRAWCGRMSALNRLFPESKVICCVRNVAWVMDSLERQYQQTPFDNTRLFNNTVERNTVYSRVDTLAQRDRLVGFSWSVLKEAVYGPYANSLLLVDYDLLTRSPDAVMRLIYQFLNEPYFEHNFETLEYDVPEFDQDLGLPGMHRVKAKVQPNNRETILPPDLFEKYSDMSFWRDLTGSKANIIAPEKYN